MVDPSLESYIAHWILSPAAKPFPTPASEAHTAIANWSPKNSW